MRKPWEKGQKTGNRTVLCRHLAAASGLSAVASGLPAVPAHSLISSQDQRPLLGRLCRDQRSSPRSMTIRKHMHIIFWQNLHHLTSWDPYTEQTVRECLCSSMVNRIARYFSDPFLGNRINKESFKASILLPALQRGIYPSEIHISSVHHGVFVSETKALFVF